MAQVYKFDGIVIIEDLTVTGSFSAPGLIATADLADSAVTTVKIAANAATGAKVPENALGSIEAVAVDLDMDDTSPFELLAADASNDRILLVRGVATEAAGGGPDVDIGSESTDPNGIVDDFQEGVWAIGDRFLGIINLPATEALDATIAVAGTAGSFDVYIQDITAIVQTAQIANDAVTTVKINANAATGAKIPENALGSIEGAAVPLAHDDTSPFELLAADASNDRILLVRGVATEEAAGTPDIDIGSESTDPNGIVDDFEAGAWVVGDRFLNIITLPATEALDATITAAGTAGEIDVYITDITPLVQTAQIANDAVTTPKLGANAATGAKVPENALGSLDVVALDLDMDDASPKELLAADATYDRLVHVRGIATEAAAGAPDFDIGSDSTDPNGIVDDFQAGVWAVGDRFKGVINLPVGEALVATIVAAGTAGSFDVYILPVIVVVQPAQMDITIPMAIHLPSPLDYRGGGGADGVIVGTLDRVAVDYAFLDDGGAFTDYTTEINSPAAGDVFLMPAAEAVGDAFYFGDDHPFFGIVINQSTNGNSLGGGPAAIAWEYGKGSSSYGDLEAAAYILHDDTNGFTEGTSTYVITWEPPGDWLADIVNSQEAFWIRARVAVADYVVTPKCTQAWIIHFSPGGGTGITIPFGGTICQIQTYATINSGLNNDSEFLLVNVTQGTHIHFCWTAGAVLQKSVVSLPITLGDEIALIQLQEDGTTEFGNASMILEICLR